MRKPHMILVAALAMAMAAPAVHAQGRPGGAGGGPPSGVGGGPPGGFGGGMGGPPAGIGGGHGMAGNEGMDAPGRAMGGSMSSGGPSALREAAMQRRAEAHARRAAAADKASDKGGFGRDTAERARALKDADLETRQAFGAFQAAEARQKTLEAAYADADANGSPRSAFGRETAARARALRNADKETRRAFGELQAAAAKAKRLGSNIEVVMTSRADGERSRFGAQTSARARLQKDATVELRRTFGQDQSALARAQRGNRSDSE